MAEIFHLPKMGQTMTEATILRWLKQEGDSFEGWEAIVEMMTDKINMEVEPQITGTLRKILAPEGAVVPLGGPLAIIGSADEDISALLAQAAGAASAPAPAEAAVGSAPAGGSVAPPAAVPRAENGSAAPAVVPTGSASGEFPSVSPRARETAGAAGLDWKQLTLAGSGFEGMITEKDVLAYLESLAGPRATPLAARIAAELGVPLSEVQPSAPGGRVKADDVRRLTGRRPSPRIEAREIPLRGVRKIIAERLHASYAGAVHVPMRVDVNMAAAADLRRQLKPVLEEQGARLTYTDLIAAAVAQALVAMPLLNATVEQDVIRIHPGVNLGIAVALDEGLVVPVIGDAETLRLADLSRSLQEQATLARSGKLPPDAFSGGTFTISNLGQYGLDSFDPIINPPQVAILGVGGIADRVVAVNGAPAVRPMMTLTLVFDHRALDGAPAAMFLSKVRELLENPARLLI